jgi:hypothetical protein
MTTNGSIYTYTIIATILKYDPWEIDSGVGDGDLRRP